MPFDIEHEEEILEAEGLRAVLRRAGEGRTVKIVHGQAIQVSAAEMGERRQPVEGFTMLPLEHIHNK